MAKVTAYGGVEEIGGNRLRIETDVNLFLDFGTSYSRLGYFFHEFLKPRKVSGLSDYFRMNLAPDIPGVYREDLLRQMGRSSEERSVDAVVLSHPHLDHAGLFPLLRSDIPLLMSKPARAILRTLEETGAAGQLNDYLSVGEQFSLRDSATGEPRKLKADKRYRATQSRVVETAEKAEFGQTRVRTVPVDHSIPGARGTIIEAPDLQLAYTGDLRLHGRRSQDTLRFLKQAAGVDALLIEGTNLGDAKKSKKKAGDEASTKFLPEVEVARRLGEFVEAAGSYCFVNYPSRDFDRLLSFHEAARRNGRRLLLTTKQAHMMGILRQEGFEVPPLNDPNLGVYLPRKGYGVVENGELRKSQPHLLKDDYESYEEPFLELENAYSPQAIRSDPGAFLVHVDYYNMTQLVDLDPPSGTYIYSKTEPFNVEMEFDDARRGHWIKHFRLKEVKAHATGHFPPEDLWHAIDTMQPRRVLPIHTENLRAFEKHLGPKVTKLSLGRPAST